MTTILSAAGRFISPPFIDWAFAIAALAALLFLVFLAISRSKAHFLADREQMLFSLLRSFQPQDGFERNLLHVLDALQGWFAAPSYAAYRKDGRHGVFILKAVKEENIEVAQLNIGYSHLLPYQKETYFLPATLPSEIIPQTPQFLRVGNVPLYFIPVDEKHCLVAGPLKTLPRRTERLLAALPEMLRVVMGTLHVVDTLSEQVSSSSISQQAVRNISHFVTHRPALFPWMLDLTQRSLDADGGMLVSGQNGRLRIDALYGPDTEKQETIRKDEALLPYLDRLLGEQETYSTRNEKAVVAGFPLGLTAIGAQTLVLQKIPSETDRRFLALWYTAPFTLRDYQSKVLQLMARRSSDLYQSQEELDRASHTYIEMLKLIAQLADNLRPSTVGRSELMERYAFATAVEMGLSEQDCREIALAAYLSNIGIVGISEDIVRKRGKYTDTESAKMQYHATAGAAIIEATIQNPRIASYIRHHHERVDGYGYPDGLKGEEIPLGAQILFAVQTFTAKLISREYRPALPFEDAENQIRIAAGTQLNEKVVRALLSWIEKAETVAAGYDGSLIPCHKMRGSPKQVCLNCPAYRSENPRCWENGKVNCSGHGDDCEHCFVYTEYQKRTTRNGATHD
ncbi:MAG: HD domain-containing phosphohydrolase [Ethanoligenens sp.]